MPPLRHRLLIAGICVLMLGCSGKGYRAAPVSGNVTLDGAPLADATVLFEPVGRTNPGPPATAVTDAGGDFTLAISEDKPGAVVGKNRVRISTRKIESDAASDTTKEVAEERVPERYNTKTDLEFEVPSGGTDSAEFKLSTAGGGIIGPGGAAPVYKD
jgi:hypothetical protein